MNKNLQKVCDEKLLEIKLLEKKHEDEIDLTTSQLNNQLKEVKTDLSN